MKNSRNLSIGQKVYVIPERQEGTVIGIANCGEVSVKFPDGFFDVYKPDEIEKVRTRIDQLTEDYYKGKL